MLLVTEKLFFSLYMVFLLKSLTFVKKIFILSLIQQTTKKEV